jgi:hypothetical protein
VQQAQNTDAQVVTLCFDWELTQLGGDALVMPAELGLAA